MGPVPVWCLMGNHFHLVVETPRPNLVAKIAGRLGRETRMMLAWIAQRLRMGTADYTAPCLRAASA